VIKVAGVATATGAIQSRQDALKRLGDIAEFFRKTEPHSPISYLLSRAQKWGSMPLELWLQDVIKDETVIFSLRQTLGFNTNLPTDES
jgi:type VI secretion system protein ImpA